MKYTALLNNHTYDIDVEETDGKLCVQLNGRPMNVDFVKLSEGIDYSLLLNNTSYQLVIEQNGSLFQVYLKGSIYPVSVRSEREKKVGTIAADRAARAGLEEIKAPMPGLVVEIEVKKGNAVTKGSGLVIVEAMKMENELKSPLDGIVKEVRVKKGDTVEKEQVLIIIE